jgi:multiple sugar transport system substrate-binding protein
MRPELEFTIMETASAALLQPLLDQFTAEQRISVRVRTLAWDSGWSELAKVARAGAGPDLSEVGSTWLGDLRATGSLRPFAAADLAALGGAGAFLPVAWQGGQPSGAGELWGIPWLVGARLMHYRRDLLAAAGVEARSAFQTADQVDRTLRQLQAAGVALPWVVPTGTTHTTLLNIASWVWGAGGDFLTPDGKRIIFHQPAARAGMRAYFALSRYLAPTVRHLRGEAPDQEFLHNPASAVAIGGPWLFVEARTPAAAPLVPDLGVAPPPGPTFVGGSYLVVWKHSRQAPAALALIRFLTQRAAQVAYSRQVGLLPVTLEALAAPPFAGDPFWQTAQRALAAGRGFPPARAWGQIEYRLAATFSTLWAEILADPRLDLDTALARHLDALALRLEPLLTQT